MNQIPNFTINGLLYVHSAETIQRMAGNFGGEFILADYIVAPSFKMSARKLQTSKELNENSPDLVNHQLVLASFDALWFETDSAVFTLQPSGL